MVSSTKIRTFAKLIDRCDRPLWVIDSGGRLAFLSAAVGHWLGVDPELLLGRLCVAGAGISDDPLDYLAASLAPPPGFGGRGTASLSIQPARRATKGDGSEKPSPVDTRFVRLGDGDDAITIAVGGTFDDAESDPVVDAAVRLRQQLDGWRRHHEQSAATALIGTSRQSERMRAQAKLAADVRGHLVIVSPPGCLAESLAQFVHQQSAAGEPVVSVDGPLMDAELLDATMGNLIHQLSESSSASATAIICGLEETPIEAQQRLVHWVSTFEERLRVIAIFRPPNSSQDEPDEPASILAGASLPGEQWESALIDLLCGLRITLHPLGARVEDIPLAATEFLDRRRASGDGQADRFSRPALDAMMVYPWPDNLREMDQAVRHAIRTCRGEAIGLDHLPLAVRSYRPNEGVPVTKENIDLDQAVSRYENDLIRRTLEAADGNRAEAARRLNISRARLLRKLEADGA